MAFEYKDYYTGNKDSLLKDFIHVANTVKPVLRTYFNNNELEQAIKECSIEYEKLIPEIPYIGGKENRLTWNLVGSVWFMAIIKVLERKGFKTRDIGKIIYEMFEYYYNKTAIIQKLIALVANPFGKKRQESLQKRALKSQERKYPEDWIMEYIPKGEGYDYGVNYTECGICKFYKKKGMMKYMPYLCIIDYPMMRSYGGIGLTRTQTIANGAKICDFRFTKGKETMPGWPPEKLKEFKRHD